MGWEMSVYDIVLCIIAVLNAVMAEVLKSRMNQYNKRVDRLNSRISELENRADCLEDVVYGIDE